MKRNETEELTDEGRGDNTSAMLMFEVEPCGWIKGRERAAAAQRKPRTKFVHRRLFSKAPELPFLS